MNQLESEFLALVNYSLFVLPEAYDKYDAELRHFREDIPALLSPRGIEQEPPIPSPPAGYPAFQHSYFSAPPNFTSNEMPVAETSYFSATLYSIPTASTKPNKLMMSPNIGHLASYYSLSATSHPPPPCSTTYPLYAPLYPPIVYSHSHGQGAGPMDTYFFPDPVAKYYSGSLLECSLFR